MKNKLLTKLLLLPVFLLMGSLTYAQTSVSGNVSEANGPIPGVNVIVKGTSNGAQSDFDGNYTLENVPSDATLIFSYIGYATQEVAVNGQSTIDVVLSEDVEALNEVVVIGYGTTTVRDATGSVASVTSEDFNQGVINSPEQLIQGKTAGVQISQNSGEPGAGISFNIRGANSVRSDNNPLFVVDGIPLSGGATAATSQDTGGFGTNAAKNPLNFLNPNDIESISILKDASATAIYGSRGANGVVIITTKSGRGVQGDSWDVSSNLSISSVRERYDLLSRDEYVSAIQATGTEPLDFGGNTDWQDVIFRTTASSNNNVGYSNNYGDGNLRATFGYGRNFGVLENTDLERVTGRLNVNHRFFDNKLKLGLQASASRVNDQTTATGGSAGFRGDLIGSALSASPTWRESVFFTETGGLFNPLDLLTYTNNTSKTNRYLVNFSAEYDITSEFSAKVNLGYDSSNSTRFALASKNAQTLQNAVGGNGRGNMNDLDLESKLLEFTLNYNKEFENSSIDILAGYSFQDFRTSGRNVSGFGFLRPEFNEMAEDLEQSADFIESQISGDFQNYGYSNTYNGDFSDNSGEIFVQSLFPDPTTSFIDIGSRNITVRSLAADTFDNTDELQSFFGRINYSIADKYLITGTVRADGSTRFGEDNRYGIFPSGAIAWKIHNEDFIGDAVSTLKLRLGAGITGNQEGIGYGNAVRRERFNNPTIGNDGDITLPGTSPQSFANNDLKWEENLQFSVGLDFGFNNDRLNGSLDLYRKTTKDLLFRIQSAQPAAQPFVFLNLPDSEVQNQGVEFAINYDIVQGDDFTWTAGFNAAYNKNEITKLQGAFNSGAINGQGLTGAFAQRFEQGQPLFSYYLREFEGFDANGQPIIEEDVQKFVGKSALPDVVGGFSTSLSYKNWTASAYLAGQFGHYVYNNTRNAFFTAGSLGAGRNVTRDVIGNIDDITPTILGNGEALTANPDVSTRFLEKGDFVRLENATVSYDWPLQEDSFFSSIVLSVTGQNLFVITDYTGLDPEVSSSAAPTDQNVLNGLPTAGIDFGAYPRPRVYTLGFNAKF